MNTYRSKILVFSGWFFITALFATVVKYATDIAWLSSISLALVTGAIGLLASLFIVRWTDRQGISRASLIAFCVVALIIVLVFPILIRRRELDPTGLKMTVFTVAGFVLTSFFLPLAESVKTKVKTQVVK
jgi:hypothetical protein